MDNLKIALILTKKLLTSRDQLYELPQKARLIFPTQKNVQKNLLVIKHVITTLIVTQY